MSDAIDKLIATFEAAIAGRPDRALRLVGLAEIVAQKSAKLRAMELARRALAQEPRDPRVVARGRALLASLIPGYHVPMMNDARRNAAWDAALRRAIAPGMHVFEIGTGAGMLAMMAARAGAERVTTCERHPVAASLARELVAANGFAGQISVVEERSENVAVGTHMPRRADLLFCDIFGDSLFNFSPFPAIQDARARLLAPGAPAVPAAVGLRVALAHWGDYERAAHLDAAAGFDLSLMRDFAVARRTVPIGTPGIRLYSEAQQALRFDLSASNFPTSGEIEIVCRAERDCDVNAIARWIRLELDAETAIEARPEEGARFFSAPVFALLPEPRRLRAGEALSVCVRYDGERLETFARD